MVSLPSRLRAQYGKAGIYAGASHFHDYWARDELFACFGALTLKTPGDLEQVRWTLEHLAAHRKDGHIPIRIGGKSQVARYLGLPTKDIARHTQDKGKNPNVDANPLFLIVAYQYERASRKKLSRTMLREVANWMIAQFKDDLLVQGPYADWEDSIKHTGARLYTNVCAYHALLAAGQLLKDPSYVERALLLKNKLQSWWNGAYFFDGENPACMTAGNLLAILWDVASHEQAKAILKHIAKRKTICPPAGFWKPSMQDVHIPLFLIGLSDYHGRMEWSWLAAVEIAAYRKLGMNREADRREKKILGLIERYGTLHEVYHNSEPVHRLIYRSETDFAWALGLLIACQP